MTFHFFDHPLLTLPGLTDYRSCNSFPENTAIWTTIGNWLWCCREFLLFDHNNFAFICSVKMIRWIGILCHIPCWLHISISGPDSCIFLTHVWNNFFFNFWETSWEFSGIYRDCLELWKPFLFHNHTKGVIAAYHSLTVSKGRDSLYDVTSEYFFFRYSLHLNTLGTAFREIS